MKKTKKVPLTQKGEHARQGDILLVQIDKFPANLKPHNSNIVAYGEMTGHSHVLDDDAVIMVDPEGNMFIETKADASLVHNTHPEITLPRGKFKVIRQREYDSAIATKERQVRD